MIKAMTATARTAILKTWSMEFLALDAASLKASYEAASNKWGPLRGGALKKVYNNVKPYDKTQNAESELGKHLEALLSYKNEFSAMGFDPANYQGAAAGGAASAEKTEETLDCDVVVIGAGGAGMTAAITASDAGRSVILLESTAMPGGNSVRSTGGMNAGPTEWRNMNEFKEAAGVEATLKKVANYPDNARIQELGKIVEEQWAAYQANPEGYFDTAELFQLDTLIGGGGLNDPSLVKKLVESSADAIAWLDSLDPEIVLHNVAAFGGASVKRIHRPVDADGKVVSVGAYVVPLLQENLEKRGITLMTDTPATEILVDNGTVVGVKAEDAGHVYTITAKAVVIAAGGFGANNDMIKAVRPELDGREQRYDRLHPSRA